jgi:serine/threonine-protein kinase RsbW/sigma-B regulation protein RsbU (phosphoserine phosphatase)
MRPGLQLTMASAPGEVARVNAAFTAFAEAHAVPAAIRRSLNVALDELLQNAIVHGLAGRPGGDGAVTIAVELLPDRLTLTLTDDGQPFNPLDTAVPDTARPVAERPVGGLGIHLVRQLMDEVHYHRQGGRNVVVLVKRLEE